ncbi:hypothetical protein BSLG_003025 [Batrachochytrium salamandrivorans]|nr:hypothetical protein BSLG_003025 [Batrachochytrium salamandrivorans]
MQISAGVMRRRATVRDGFHLVTLVQGHPCRVPDFHVAFQPSHSTSACTTTSFVKNNAVLLQHTTDHKKRLAIVHAVFDIAVESPSVSNQIQVWVRNGYNIREQAKHYKDAVMREAYDHDMLLLQYAAVCLGPDKLLSMLVDRYGLVSWFQGHTVSQDTSHYESSQILSFVQDLLQVIIIVLTERSSAAAVSPTDELRREMIHYLAVHRSGTAYSELSRRVADSLMDAAADSAGTMNDRNTLVASAASFDALLSSVAHFKFPDGASDHGLYELKDEMYAQVDQWFWHYTSNEREDLNDVLRKRLEKKRALSRQGGREASFEDEAVRRPKLLKIEPCTGFDRLSSVIHSPIFNQILFYSLWNVTRTAAESGQEPASNETILSEAIHLLVVRAATRPTTLLELILSLVDRANEDDIKEQAPRLRYLKQSGLSGSSEALTELEQRKLAAKTRQANIMAQFAQAQQSFMANFGDDMDDMDDAEDQSDFEDRDEAAHSGKDTLDRPDHRAWRFATGTCIVCQEDAVAGGKMYGMLCLLRHTTVRRQILFSDAANVAKVLAASPSSFDVESDPAVKIDSKGVHCYNNASGKRPMDPAVAHTGLGASSSSTGATTSPSQTLPFSGSSSQPCPLKRVSFEGVTATSCGHLMHFSCFNTYTNSITARQLSQPTRNHPEDQDANEFMCPLCKSLGNAVLPVVWSSRHETVNWRGSDRVYACQEQPGYRDGVKSSFSDGHTGGPLIDASRTISDLGAEVALDELETSGMSSTSVMSLTDSLTQAFVDHTTLAPAALTFKSSSDTARLHELHVIYTRNVYNALNGLFEGEVRRCSCVFGFSEAALGATFYTKCTQTALVEFGDRYLTSFFGDHGIKGLYPKPLEEDPSHVHPPVLLRDGFSHLVVLSMSVIPARVATRSKDESEVFQWIRVLWIFELVRCVVSVVESILLYGDAWIMDPRVLSAAAAAAAASSHPVRSVYSDDPASIRESNPEAGQSTRSSEPEHTDGGDNDDDELKYGGLCHLIRVVLSEMKLMPDARTYVHKSIRADIVLALFERTGLVFVRRCAVLLYARFGLVPPGISGFGFDLVQPDQDHVGGLESDRGFNAAACLGGSELERLCKYLDLPSAATLASLPIIHDRVFGHMVLHWVHDFGRSMANHFGVVWSTEAPRRLERERQRAAGATRTLLSSISTDVLAPPSAPHVSLDLPLVFELANLPLRLATLFEESRRKVCKRCGTIPLDPALCVLCGMILCSQSYCCSDEDHGECNQHIQECGGSIGIFLLIKQAMMILLLPNGKGTFMDLPYLDAHGEVDPQLRRGRPLFLNRKRYAEIRKLWLTHGVPSYIARKIDQAFDSGGWSTF